MLYRVKLPSVDDGPVFCVGPDTVSDVSVGVPAVTQMPSQHIVIIKSESESDILNILVSKIKKQALVMITIDCLLLRCVQLSNIHQLVHLM